MLTLIRATLLTTIVLASLPALARDIYRSDFRSPATQPANLPDWRLQAGRYTLESGWLHVVSDKSNPEAFLTPTHDGDGTFRATVRNAEHCHRTMLLARGVYRLEINNQFSRVELHRLADKQWRMVGQAANYDLYSQDRHTFELRLAFVGRRVAAFVDDKKLIDYEDPAAVPAGGHYGLAGGWGSDVYWRDVRLSDRPDLRQWPTEPAAKSAPRDLVEVAGVRCDADDAIYFDGQPAKLRLKLKTRKADGAKIRVVYRLIDVRQRTVAEKSAELSLPAGKETTAEIEFTPPARGCFKVALFAGTGQADLGWVEDLGGFTVVPEELGERAVENSFFGGHMDGINLDWHLQAGRKLGVRWARCHDMLQHTWWTRIQPDRPDQWLWQDKTQASIGSAGMTTLGEFLWTPKWANTSGRPTDPPTSQADFARYVAETVGHYRRSIRHWEVWNEPHYSGFWTGSPAQYAQLLATAYASAKKGDPNCFVLGGGGVELGRRGWIEAMLRALPAKSMDGFSIHYARPEQAAEQLAWLRGALRRHGDDVPLWNTEASVVSSSFLDQCRTGWAEPEARYHFRNACFELVRMYMENLGNGVQRVFYYELADPWRFKPFAKPRVLAGQRPGTTMWDEGRMLKPIAAAHAALAFAIDGRTFATRIDASPLHAFIFEGKDGAAAVHYADFREFAKASTIQLSLPTGARADDFSTVDFMGNESPARLNGAGRLVLPLSREPVYLLYRGINLAQRMRQMYLSRLDQ